MPIKSAMRMNGNGLVSLGNDVHVIIIINFADRLYLLQESSWFSFQPADLCERWR